LNIKISVAEENDIERVAHYLSESPHATPYHHMQWLQSVKKAYGFDYYYLIAVTGIHIVGVLPLCRFKSLLSVLVEYSRQREYPATMSIGKIQFQTGIKEQFQTQR